jgi:hypothetical protein
VKMTVLASINFLRNALKILNLQDSPPTDYVMGLLTSGKCVGARVSDL